MREQWQLTPTRHGPGFFLQQIKQQSTCVQTGLKHVDVRIGLEADEDVGVAHHFFSDVAVQIQRDSQRRIGRELTYFFQQCSFAIGGVFGNQCAVQIEQDRIDSIGSTHRLQDTLTDCVVGIGCHRAARIGGGRNRCNQYCIGQRFSQRDKGTHCRARTALVVQCRFAIAWRKGAQRCCHGRERIGLVIEARDQDFFHGV